MGSFLKKIGIGTVFTALISSCCLADSTIVNTQPDFQPTPPNFNASDVWIRYHYLYSGTPTGGAGEWDELDWIVKWSTEDLVTRYETNGTLIQTGQRYYSHLTHSSIVATCNSGSSSDFCYENNLYNNGSGSDIYKCESGGGYTNSASPEAPQPWYNDPADIDYNYTTNSVPDGYRVEAGSSYMAYIPAAWCGHPASFVSGAGKYWDLELTYTNGNPVPVVDGFPPTFCSVNYTTTHSVFNCPYSTELDNSNNFEFDFASTNGIEYSIYASTDLTNWSEIGTLVASDTNSVFVDTNASGFAARYYYYTDGTNYSDTFGFLTFVVSPGGTYGGMFISDPFLNASGNALSIILTNLPDGSHFYTYNEAAQSVNPSNTFSSGVWTPDPNLALLPSQGGFVSVAGTNSVTLKFSGTLAQGALTCTIPPNYSQRSSMIPLSHDVDFLNFPAVDGDQISMWANNAGVTMTYTYYEGDGWLDEDFNYATPIFYPGMSCYIWSASATNRTWTYNLSASP